MIKGIHHTALNVLDLDRAIAFYSTAGCFELALRFEIEDSARTQALFQLPCGVAQVALLRGPTGYLELFEFASASAAARLPQVHEAGIRHICVIAQDCQPVYEALLAAGATAHAPPSGLGTGALYCYLRDPEGNIVELEGAPWAEGMHETPWYTHTAIVSADIKRLGAFYENLVGDTIYRSGAFGPDPKFDRVAGLAGIEFDGAWLRAANAQIELWRYRAPTTETVAPRVFSAPGWSHICFECDNVESEYVRLSGLGVEFLGPPAEGAFSRFVFARDVDGNIVELMTPTRKDLSVDALAGLAIPGKMMELVATLYRRADLRRREGAP